MQFRPRWERVALSAHLKAKAGGGYEGAQLLLRASYVFSVLKGMEL
jgi:hypothetical protein